MTDYDSLLSVVSDVLGKIFGARSDGERCDRLVDAAFVLDEVWPFIEKAEAENKRLAEQLAAAEKYRDQLIETMRYVCLLWVEGGPSPTECGASMATLLYQTIKTYEDDALSPAPAAPEGAQT